MLTVSNTRYRVYVDIPTPDRGGLDVIRMKNRYLLIDAYARKLIIKKSFEEIAEIFGVDTNTDCYEDGIKFDDCLGIVVYVNTQYKFYGVLRVFNWKPCLIWIPIADFERDPMRDRFSGASLAVNIDNLGLSPLSSKSFFGKDAKVMLRRNLSKGTESYKHQYFRDLLLNPEKYPIEEESEHQEEEPIQLTEEPMHRAEEPEQRAKEPMHRAEEPVQLTEEPVHLTDEPEHREDELVQKVDEPVQLTDEHIQKEDEPIQNIKDSEHTESSNDKVETVVNQFNIGKCQSGIEEYIKQFIADNIQQLVSDKKAQLDAQMAKLSSLISSIEENEQTDRTMLGIVKTYEFDYSSSDETELLDTSETDAEIVMYCSMLKLLQSGDIVSIKKEICKKLKLRVLKVLESNKVMSKYRALVAVRFDSSSSRNILVILDYDEDKEFTTFSVIRKYSTAAIRSEDVARYYAEYLKNRKASNMSWT